MEYYIYHPSAMSTMYQFIPLDPCDYLQKFSIKINATTEEGNGQTQI